MVALNEIEAEALDGLVSERVTKIKADREQAEQVEAEAVELAKRLRALRKQAVHAIKERNELIPAFLTSITETAKLAKQLTATRDSYQEAVKYAIKLGGSTGTQYPRMFGLDPAERDALRTALTSLQSIGGVV